MLSLLLLPFKILKFIAISALKIFILVWFIALCAFVLNFAANPANAATGVIGASNVHSFQKGPGTERNYTARC